jgi:uncharacterized membrane protein
MDIPADLVPGAWHGFAAVIYVLVMALALWTAPWYKLRDNEAVHVYLGAIVMLTVVWSMRAGILPGLNFHLLGATLLCLMFDWQFALLAVSVVVLATTVNGAAGWDAIALNILLMGVLPVLFTRILLYLAQRHLPHNFFIYIFVNAFLAAGLSSCLAGMTAAGVYMLSDTYTATALAEAYLPFMLLIFFPEAFFNGMMMTLIVAYRPRWVATFHDRWYIEGK